MQVRNNGNAKPENFLEWKLMGAWEGVSPEEALRLWEDLPALKREEYLAMCGRLRRGYPFDYLLPYTEIGPYSFRLREGVLIPRPETEELVEIIRCAPDKPPTLIDIGCGSGLIGISLHTDFEQVAMVDISETALAIARDNILLNGITNVSVYQSNLLDNLPNPSTDRWLVANLPYVPLGDKQKEIEYRTKFEPDLAIYSGRDGLDLFRKLVQQLSELPLLPTKMFFELDPRNVETGARLLETRLSLSTEIITDSEGRARFLVASIS